MMSALANDGRFSGAVVATRAGRTIYARGFGCADREGLVPFTPGTPVDGASLAKPVTAAAVLLLAREQRIDLDTSVVHYISEYPDRSTTTRHLLSHTAGLPSYDVVEKLNDPRQPAGNAEMLRQLKARGFVPSVPSGRTFSYCNMCYDALALLVERVSGQPYQTFVKERLLTPAGARDAFLRPAHFADWRGPRTRGYAGAVPADAYDHEAFYGSANLYFSARDLAAWLAAWAAPTSVSQTLRTAALAPAYANGRVTGLTLGNWYCDRPRVRCYYRGHHEGFHHFAYWDTAKRATVVFVSNNSLAPDLQHQLPKALIEAAEGRPERATQLARVAPLPLEGNPAAGSYRSAGNVLVIQADGGRMRLIVPGGAVYALFPIGSRTLYAPGLDAYLSIAPNPGRADDRLIWRSVFGDTFWNRDKPSAVGGRVPN